jgi:phosphoribosylglycinamide formyltransferase-1
MPKMHRPRVAVFASGHGTTFRAVADAVHDGLADFEIALLICDHDDVGVLDHAKEVNRLYGMNIKVEIINKKRYPGGARRRGQTTEEAEATLRVLEENNIDHVALIGFWRIVGPEVTAEYGWTPEFAAKDPKHRGLYLARMSNTHPGILPATTDTYGVPAQAKVLELGLKETAHTLLVVTSGGIDDGPVIAENRVPVFAPGKYPSKLADTPEKLFARVQRVEKAHLPLDLDKFLKDQQEFLAS